jgi:hypothetical protein
MIQKRLEAIPRRIETHLASPSAAELEELGVRLLEVSSLDELLPKTRKRNQ